MTDKEVAKPSLWNLPSHLSYLALNFWKILFKLDYKLAILLPITMVVGASTIYLQSYAIAWMIKSLYAIEKNKASASISDFLPLLIVVLLAVVIQAVTKFQKYLSLKAEWHFRTEFETLSPRIYTQFGLQAYANDGPRAQALQRSDDAVYDARFFLPQFMDTVVSSGTTIIGIAILIYFSWKAALVLLPFLFISALIQLNSRLRFVAQERKEWAKQAAITNVRRSFSSVHNYIAFRAFGMVTNLIDFIKNMAENLRDSRFSLFKKEKNESLFSLTILVPAIACSIWFIFHDYKQELFDTRWLIFLILSSIGLIREVLGITLVLAMQVSSTDNMLLLLKVKMEGENLPLMKPQPLSRINLARITPTNFKTLSVLEINSLTFGYPNAPTFYDNFSRTIQLGNLTFLIGGNGVGKSTLLNLVTGVLTPQSGYVQFVNQDRVLSFGSLVPQNGMKLDLPIRDIISSLGGTKISDDQLIAVFSRLGVWGDLEKKKGLNTILGHRSGLSGGQEQRVILSFGLIKLLCTEDKPGALILDEPFNHLSPEGVRLTVDAFLEHARNCSCPLIIGTHSKDLLTPDSDIIFLERTDNVPTITTGTHGGLCRDYAPYQEYMSGGNNK